MSVTQKPHTELNAVQVSLLRLFNIPMSEEETIELKRMMVSHYSALLEKEVNRVVAEKGYTQKDFDEMLNSEE
jgi:hypothetical protein